ncbi:hypothetical protein HELRODRAFT_156388 [Helobdella robusta]|uniref:Uncharacterized protein n=1 Tax=Helobdella robusta TaxID=6412 RepID=T1ELV1_HELRO|nr:hypothetical protein HELRODRAFT_156388 [Helobdella robusta]ESO10088.1 hypothetical protein HELRODRAFT_156388 [Helobdella robusta]
MSTGIYGGDEVGAVVLDIGSHTTRGGFAGEDMPKADFKTTVGVLADAEDITDGSTRKKYCIDTVNIKVPRNSMEMVNFVQDCMIEDWDTFEKVFEYFYKSYIKSSADQHPLLMSEAPWNISSKREKLTEIMFEKYSVPAFYLCKNPVLSAFASGRSTALILDSGASHTTAVPVYDGYVIQQAVTKTSLGGNFLIEECKNYFQHENIDIIPHFSVNETIEDFIQSVIQCSDNNYEEEIESMEATGPVHHEFPDGFNRKFGLERFRIAESLFDTNYIRSHSNPLVQSVSQIISSAIAKVDIDMRPSMYNGIIVVGSNSLLNGFSDRLMTDLANKLPASTKLKVNASQINVERRFSSWIGGSILASLGSFQQLWISKQEYEESGRNCVDKKCP